MVIIRYGAQVWGSVNLNVLNTPIAISSSNNTFSFDVDGVNYSIVISNGTYYGSINHFVNPIVQEINKQLSSVNCPVFARLGGINMETHINVLVLEHSDLESNHSINNIDGSAVNGIFGEIRFINPPTTI